VTEIKCLFKCFEFLLNHAIGVPSLESVRELQSLCYGDLKTIFETRRCNFMCQLYDSSNSLVRACYVVHMLH